MFPTDLNKIKELKQTNLWLVPFGLSDEDFERVIVLSTRALIESDSLVVFHQKMRDLIKGDQQTFDKIIAAVITNRFYPHQDEITSFAEFVKKIGWQAPPPEVPKELPEKFVERVLIEAKISPFDSIEKSRLVFILTAFIKKERTLDETKAALTRSHKVGGMEFDQDTTDQIINLIVEKLKGAILEIPEQKLKVEDIKPPALLPPPSPSLPPPAKSREEKGGLKGEEEEKEIAKAAAVVKEKIAPVAKPVLSAEEAAGRIIKEAGLEFDAETRKKFVSAVEARLRDARDAFETRDLLERGQERGGLNIKGLPLARVMEALEKIVSEWLAAGLMEARQAKEEARQAKAAVFKEAAAASQVPPRPRPKPKPVVPMVSPASAVPVGRLIVADVVAPGQPSRPSRRLAGPVEEFANMTAVEFRRLSSDPKEAVMKIKDRLDLLEEQGVGQKIAGIKAWRNSPINRLYLSLARAALLSGRPVGEISAEHGPDGLTDAESKAISALNDQIRF